MVYCITLININFVKLIPFLSNGNNFKKIDLQKYTRFLIQFHGTIIYLISCHINHHCNHCNLYIFMGVMYSLIPCNITIEKHQKLLLSFRAVNFVRVLLLKFSFEIRKTTLYVLLPYNFGINAHWMQFVYYSPANVDSVGRLFVFVT